MYTHEQVMDKMREVEEELGPIFLEVLAAQRIQGDFDDPIVIDEDDQQQEKQQQPPVQPPPQPIKKEPGSKYISTLHYSAYSSHKYQLLKSLILNICIFILAEDRPSKDASKDAPPSRGQDKSKEPGKYHIAFYTWFLYFDRNPVPIPSKFKSISSISEIISYSKAISKWAFPSLISFKT